MGDVLDAVFGFLSNAAHKLDEINTTPYVIIVLLLVLIISTIVQLKQMEKVSKRFAEGAIDNKTVKLCTRFRKRFIFPRSAELHDIFCCRLCSMHMERNEEDLFFANINDIKKITEQVNWRLHLVLVAYLTKQRYLDWADMYRTTKIGMQSATDWLKTQQLTYDEAQLKKAVQKITNPKVREILNTLTEEA